jgi:hypothetical protein
MASVNMSAIETSHFVVDAWFDADAQQHTMRLAYSSVNAFTRPERIAFTSVVWSFCVWSA